MSIRRGHVPSVDRFTIVPNDWLRDVRLSRRARGLLAELMSHAQGWETSIEALVAGGPEGRDAIRTALGELMDLGYLTRSEDRSRDAEGHLGSYDYVITDPAGNPQGAEDNVQVTGSTMTGEPTSGEPTEGEPTEGEHPHKKNKFQKTIQKNSPAEPSVIEKAFEVFWQAYPRKVAKPAARKAWAKALKAAKSPAPIMAGLSRFQFSPDPSFIPHPATWLNQERWNDTTPGQKAAPKLNPWEM